MMYTHGSGTILTHPEFKHHPEVNSKDGWMWFILGCVSRDQRTRRRISACEIICRMYGKLAMAWYPVLKKFDRLNILSAELRSLGKKTDRTHFLVIRAFERTWKSPFQSNYPTPPGQSSINVPIKHYQELIEVAKSHNHDTFDYSEWLRDGNTTEYSDIRHSRKAHLNLRHGFDIES